MTCFCGNFLQVYPVKKYNFWNCSRKCYFFPHCMSKSTIIVDIFNTLKAFYSFKALCKLWRFLWRWEWNGNRRLSSFTQPRVTKLFLDLRNDLSLSLLEFERYLDKKDMISLNDLYRPNTSCVPCSFVQKEVLIVLNIYSYLFVP